LPALRQLYELQAFDIEIDRNKERLRVIATALGDDTDLQPLRERVNELQTMTIQANGRQRDFDLAVSALSDRITQAEARMYSGTVKNPRELEDLQSDISQLGRQRTEQEDQLLVVLDESEGLQTEMDTLGGQIQTDEAAWQRQQTSMTEEQAILKAQVDTLTGLRTAKAGTIPPPDLALYDQVRRTHYGKAVAMVLSNGACESCRVGLSNKQLQQVRTATSPVRCNNCSLILLAE
jgi:predicted  nucleic acid-binding Zn-ribbon protein